MTSSPWEPLLQLLPNLPLDGLERYVAELVRWNRNIRLVGPRDRSGIALQVVDALLPFLHLRPRFPLLDIGSGAGLPGILLALVHPNQTVVCLEPRTKRVAFLRHARRQLELSCVRVIPERTEQALARYPELRGFAATVTARAVADVPSLLLAAAPFLAPGGSVILPRGGDEVATLPADWEYTCHLPYPAPKPLGSRMVQEFRPTA